MIIRTGNTDLYIIGSLADGLVWKMLSSLGPILRSGNIDQQLGWWFGMETLSSLGLIIRTGNTDLFIIYSLADSLIWKMLHSLA